MPDVIFNKSSVHQHAVGDILGRLFDEIGQIREVKADLVVAKRDSLNEKQYFLPKNLIVGFDRHSVYFRIMKGETETYRLH
jgi:hypothetical protein